MATILGLEAFDLLKKYNIPCIYSEDIRSISQLREWRPPAVMKAISTRHIHKANSGALSFVYDKKDFEKEFNRLRKKGEVIVQNKVKGTEVIIGAKSDETFGKVVMFGLGGTLTEVFGDVSFRVAPLTKKDAQDMIKEVKGYKILREGIKLDVLEKTLLKVSDLVCNELVYELDINPFVINHQHGFAVDARVII